MAGEMNLHCPTKGNGSKSLHQIARPKPLRDCGIEELAIHQLTANPSGGIMFARKVDHAEKDAAREAITDLFTPARFPKGLSILTMPGLFWTFESQLLRAREGNWNKRKGPHRTHLTCIENDRSIYHAALMRMPGIRQKHSVMQMLSATPFAERAVRNRWIGRYFFGEVDAMMEHQSVPFDAAWLDYTGPLSNKRLSIIAAFFDRCVRHTLIVTSLRARWNRDTSAAIDKAGDYFRWVRAAIPGAVLHELSYQDGASPMAQIALQKTTHGTRRTVCASPCGIGEGTAR